MACKSTAKKAKIAAGLVIFRKSANIEYLLLQTSYGEHHWTPPKGHVDPGETDPMVTALRETEEESGLIESDLKIFVDSRKELIYEAFKAPKIVIYWLAELIKPSSEVKLSDEHQDYKWLKLEEACKYGKYDDLKSLLINYDKYIKSLK